MTDPTPLERFTSSMAIDYEKWHDGIGYDLDALREADPTEREVIEHLLLDRGPQDWRDVEALAALDTPGARLALKAALESPDHQVRAAVTRCAPELFDPADRVASMVQALERADFYGGLTQTLDQVESFHPPEVIDALFRGVLARDGEVAVHFAAMLMFLHGKAAEAFDWEHRPFFLTFHTTDSQEREAAFRQLCERTGIDGSKYL